MCAQITNLANLQRRALSRAIRGWRKASGMSGVELSTKAGWSSAKMSMMQNAACPIFADDILVLAMLLGIDEATRRRAYNSANRARRPTAWDYENPGAPRLGWTLDDLEAESAEIRVVATETLPPLVRTRAYAEALQLGQSVAVESPYSAKLRDEILTGVMVNGSPRLHLVVTEAVLRRLVGGVVAMTDQLTWLLQLISVPGVTVRVVPDGVGAYPGIGTGFGILSFIEKHFDDVVFVQQLHHELWLETADDRVLYEKTFDRLSDTALPEADSTDFIAVRLLELQDQQ